LRLRVESCGCVVRSDPALLGQILRNLLSNAIKYTREGSVVLRGATDSRACAIEVADTGIGIAADQMAHIYDEFFQVSAAAGESRQGYGLGLTIVSRLVSLLGLRLTAQSEPGRGSIFRLELPVSCAHPGAGA
jgi:two-component system CheB/CheR fusion protein